MKTEKVWPYVLPFPLDAEKRRLIWSILQSRVGISILRRMKTDSLTYQPALGWVRLQLSRPSKK